MAIVTEFYRTREDNINLHRTYSNEGVLIKKVGTDEIYEEAIDIENSGFSYEETEELIEIEAEYNAFVEKVKEEERNV
jgi:hypothetical protein